MAGRQESQRQTEEMNLEYPIKHWLTSLTLGPLIMIIYDMVDNSKLMNDAGGIFFLFLVFGLLFSLPLLVLYALTYNFLTKNIKSNLMIKVILNLLGVLGIVITFSLIKGSMTVMASVFYSIGLIIASLFYNIRTKEIERQTIDG